MSQQRTQNKTICFLTSRHRYDDARIYHKEANTLINAGYNITLIAQYRETSAEQLPGIRVVLFRKSKLLRKMSSLFNLVKLGLNAKANCYHCHEGDSSLLAAVIIKCLLWLFGRRPIIVYDSHEHWPSSFYDKAPKGLKNLTRLLFSWYEIFLAWQTDSIVTANDIVKERFSSLFPNKQVIRLYNVPSLKLFKKPVSNEKKYDFCHEGSMTFERGLHVLFNTFIELNKIRTDWNFLFIGSLKNDSERKYVEQCFQQYPTLRDQVEFTGWLPYRQVSDYLQQCKSGGIYFHGSQNNMYGGPPNKLFNYMRYGLPVIAPAFPEIQKIITKYQCGYLFENLTTDVLLPLFESILDDKDHAIEVGKRGLRAVKSTLNWEAESSKLIKLYKNLVPLKDIETRNG